MSTKHPLRKVLAATVDTAVKASGRSVLSLATSIDMHHMTLTRRLRGDSSFSVDELAAIANELGVSLPELLATAERNVA